MNPIFPSHSDTDILFIHLRPPDNWEYKLHTICSDIPAPVFSFLVAYKALVRRWLHGDEARAEAEYMSLLERTVSKIIPVPECQQFRSSFRKNAHAGRDNPGDAEWHTPLHLFCSVSSTSSDGGGNINAFIKGTLTVANRKAYHVVDTLKHTPLDNAIIAGNPDAVKLLLAAGADPNYEKGGGAADLPPLGLALKRAVERRDIHQRGGKAHEAWDERNLEIIRMLVKAGGRVDDSNGEVVTPVKKVWDTEPTLRKVVKLAGTDKEERRGSAEERRNWVGRMMKSSSVGGLRGKYAFLDPQTRRSVVDKTIVLDQKNSAVSF